MREHWFYLIALRFIGQLRFSGWYLVTCMMASQLSALLASLLPLKVVMLLGGTKIPSYMPEFAQELGITKLVIYLTAAAMLFFLAYLALEKHIDSGVERQGALFASNSGSELFERQTDVAKRIYKRFISLTANILVALTAFTVLFPIYPGVLYFALIYLTATAIVAWLASQIKIQHATWGGIGFLAIFLFMVTDALYFSEVDTFHVIASLLISRQAFKASAGVMADHGNLIAHRAQLTAVLGNMDEVEDSPQTSGNACCLSFWTAVRHLACEDTCKKLLNDALDIECNDVSVTWIPSALHGICFLQASYSGEKSGQILISLYDTPKSRTASHEASLLSETSGQPFLDLLHAGKFHGFAMHIYEWQNTEKADPLKYNSTVEQCCAFLMHYPPSEIVIDAYTSGYRFFWEKLDSNLIEALSIYCLGAEHTEQKFDIEPLNHAIPLLRSLLSRLPMVVINPDMWKTTLWNSEQGIHVSYWGRWSLGPAGSAWPVKEGSLAGAPEQALAEAKRSRPDLDHVTLADIKLAALSYALVQAFERQDLESCFQLAPPIMELLAARETGGCS